MKITVKQLKQLIKEEVKRTIMLREDEQPEMPSKKEVFQAAKEMGTPEEAREQLENAGIDVDQFLANPAVQRGIDTLARRLASSGGESMNEELKDASLTLTAGLPGAVAILHGLFDMGVLGIDRYYDGNTPLQFMLGGMAAIIAGYAADKYLNPNNRTSDQP